MFELFLHQKRYERRQSHTRYPARTLIDSEPNSDSIYMNTIPKIKMHFRFFMIESVPA